MPQNPTCCFTTDCGVQSCDFCPDRIPRAYVVVISGISNGTCHECDVLNKAHLLCSSGEGSCAWGDERSVYTLCGKTYTIHVQFGYSGEMSTTYDAITLSIRLSGSETVLYELRNLPPEEICAAFYILPRTTPSGEVTCLGLPNSVTLEAIY